MISKPKLEDRKKQPYVGIRIQTPMGKMKKVIPQLLGEVADWLDKRGVTPAGPPFMGFTSSTWPRIWTLSWASQSRAPYQVMLASPPV
jgi:hypothetical protein